jgi:hypothetical protein
MLRRAAILMGPGLIIGLILFTLATVAGASGGDGGFGKHQMLFFSGMPLSLLIGDAAYAMKTAIPGSAAWNTIDLILLLLNWALISLAVMTLLRLVSRSGAGG